MSKIKKKKEGRRIRSLSPMSKVSPYIMVKRSDAQNYISDTLDIEAIEDYIFKKRSEGFKGFGMMHVFLAAYVRTISQRPGINRYIRGQKIYARNSIEIMLTIKREMKLESPDTVLKIDFEPNMTANDIYKIINDAVEESRNSESGFDDTAKILNYIPGLVLKFIVWLLRFFDYFGWLPRFLTHLSPFHGSFAITSMGSLGIPPIYHHIYDFGNIPVFMSFGAKRTVNVLEKNGTITQKRYVDYKVVTDERICDGYYFASALKLVRENMLHPDRLDFPPEKIIEDIK
ncbi:MAG: hypothetical protein RR057_02035 [Clostridia bacterium]